jgi:hypothetical protein
MGWIVDDIEQMTDEGMREPAAGAQLNFATQLRWRRRCINEVRRVEDIATT